MNGTCPAGTAISYKVNDTTTQDFHVLKDNGSTLTLISNCSLATSVGWDSSGNTVNGPRTATQALEDVTNDWVNVVVNTYNESTGTATRARMITRTEAEFVGCRAYETSCPIWLADGGSYHWVSSAYVSSSELAWAITNSNLRYLDGYSVLNLYAVRAVIDIDK